MQFVVSKQNLQKELAFVEGVVEKKNTIPVLSNILIESVGEFQRVDDVVLDEREPIALHQMLDIGERAGEEVVDAGHLMTIVNKPVAKMGADKSGAAENQCMAHRGGPRARVFGRFRRLVMIRHRCTGWCG